MAYRRRLRLRLVSPCVDAGNIAAMPTGITTDRDGKPRWTNIPAVTDTGGGSAPLLDLGAFEAVAELQVIWGGPYVVTEGYSVLFRTFACSPDGSTLSYAWDFDEDGQFDDATGSSPVFSAGEMRAPQTFTVAVQVTAGGTQATVRTAMHVVSPVYVDDSASGLNAGTSWAMRSRAFNRHWPCRPPAR
jgi:hypothetical protein